MPIPNPSLDDVTFDQLVEEAKKNIPLFTKFWTNYNLSDPGITLLELFAWLTENQIYSLNRITKRNYLKFLKLLGVKPLEADPPKIDLTISIKQYSKNKNDNASSFYLAKRTPFILEQEEIFVETAEGLWVIPSLQMKRCVIYSKHQYSDAKIVFSSASFTSGSSSKVINSLDTDSHSSINSEPYFFLFGEDPKDDDCFYLNMDFSSKDVRKGSYISLSFYLFEKDLPPIGQHGFERPEDFIDNDYQSQLLWEYAHYEVKRNNRDSISNDIGGRKDKRKQSISAEDATFDDASPNRDIVWSPLNVEDDTLSFSKSGKITFQYPTDNTREKFDLFKNLPPRILFASEDRASADHENEKGELWVRCRIIKQNFHYIPPRMEGILPNTVSCSFGYTMRQNLRNKSPSVSRLASDKETSQDRINDNEYSQYQELSNGLANQIFEIDTDLRFPLFKLNYLKVSKEKWERVDDLISSLPYDKHYMILDEKKGLIKFGDGENGKVPPRGSEIEAEYKIGNMQYWWIEQGKHFTIDENHMEEKLLKSTTPLYRQLVAVNLLPSSIGRKAESIREAIIRARHDLIIPFKGVTKSDYEYIAKNTPGLRVGKVKAMTSKHRGEGNTLIIAAVPYSVSSSARRLDSSQDFRDAIRRHVEKHKLITTSIRVIEPKYVGISVNTRIRLAMKDFEQISIMNKRIAKMLESYFSPLSIEQPSLEGEGWDFGRNVYRSKIVALLESLPEVEAVLALTLQGSADNGFHTDLDGNIIMDELNLVYLKDISISFV